VTNSNWQTALHAAGEGGISEVVRILVAAGADVCAKDWRGQNALLMAASTRTVVIGVFLPTGGYVRPANCHHQMDGLKAVFRALLAAGADAGATDDSENTVLHALAHGGDVASVRLVLAATRCDVNVANAYGQSALHLASFSGNVECVQRSAPRC